MKAIVEINKKGINAVVVKNSTAVRQAVINHRIGNETMAATKAMMIELLKTKMANGVAHFAFLKKDGSLREMFATTCKSLVEKHIVGTGVSRECFATTAVFDCELGEWRSFRWENLVCVY